MLLNAGQITVLVIKMLKKFENSIRILEEERHIDDRLVYNDAINLSVYKPSESKKCAFHETVTCIT